MEEGARAGLAAALLLELPAPTACVGGGAGGGGGGRRGRRCVRCEGAEEPAAEKRPVPLVAVEAGNLPQVGWKRTSGTGAAPLPLEAGPPRPPRAAAPAEEAGASVRGVSDAW